MAPKKKQKTAKKPEGLLLPYQRAWVRDASQFKLWLKGRQIGFSFAATYEAVMDCLERPAIWVFLSASERQAVELAEKAKLHCDAIGAAAELLAPESELVGDFLITKHELRLPGGGRIIALPANPRTARGYAGNVVLDEFAFHRDAKAIYAAVFPFTTRGYRLLIGSTPFGESGLFYELWSTQNRFSKHKTDIYDAQRQGLQVDLKALREGVHDEDIWQQEYCCSFISDASSVIPWEQIVQATHPDASLEPAPGFERCGPLGFGYDVARYRDLAVTALVEQIGDVFWLRGLRRMRRASFAEQKETAAAWLRGSDRGCLDATGMGAPLAEEMVSQFGGSRVEAITFTAPAKEALVIELQRVFAENRIRIPDDRDLRAAIHAVRKYATATGHFRYDANRTEKGHADEFWALALAVNALSGPRLSTDYRASERVRPAAAVAGGWGGFSYGVGAARAARGY